MARFRLSVVVAVLSCCWVGAHAAAKDLPSTFLKCNRNDKDLGKCLIRAVNNALPQMKNGIKELGVPAIDPLHITALTISQGSNSPISLKQDFKNIVLTGVADTKLVTYNPDIDKYILRTNGLTKRVNLEGDYTMTGRILLLPIVGKGRANITMVNLKTVHEMLGEPRIKDGIEYIHFREYNVKLIPGRVYLNFEGLFNGDRRLGNQMNKFMNDNWELIFNELRGGYEDTLSYVFKEVTNKLFSKVPMDRIFLRSQDAGKSLATDVDEDDQSKEEKEQKEGAEPKP